MSRPLPDATDRLPRPALTVERVPPERWEEISDWDDAVAAMASPSVYLTRDWVTAWWASFSEGLEPLLLRVTDAQGMTVGLAPLYLERPRRLPLRRLGILGDKVVGSEYLGLVAEAGREAEVTRAALDFMARAGTGWDVAELVCLVDGNPAGTGPSLTVEHAFVLHPGKNPCAGAGFSSLLVI